MSDLRATLQASLFLAEATAAIERARVTRSEAALDRAAKLLNSEKNEALPDDEQRHLALLYAEAAHACYGGF